MAPSPASTSAPTGSVPTTTEANRVARGQNRVIWLLLGAAFVAMLNETTMAVAIPHLITDLGITAVEAQWMTTAFMLTMAVVIPITGFLLQRFSTRAMFVTAMSLFSAGTLLAIVAPGFEVLIVARVIQASGTAVMMPLLMTTVMTVVLPEARGRMMGRISIVMALAPAIGPSLSGFLLDHLGWRWIFIIVLPIALVALAVGARWIHNIGTTRKVPIDVLSVILSAFGFGGLVYGLSQVGSHGGPSGGPSPALFVALAVGVVGLGLFVWRQILLQRKDGALLDLRLFRSRNFTLSTLQLTVMSMAFFGVLTLLPLVLQNVLKLTAFESGLIVLPGSLAMGLLGPLIGRLYDRWGTSILLVPGALIVTAALWFFTTIGPQTPIWLLVVVQTFMMIGLAASFTPLFTAALGSVEPRFYSYGSAIISTVQQVAGAAGVALLITIQSSVATAAVAGGADPIAAGASGAHVAFLVGGVIALPLIVGAFLIRKPADNTPGVAPVGH